MKPFRTEFEFQEVVRLCLLASNTPDVPVRLWKIHGGPFQQSGMADLIGCIDGVFVALEFKRAGGKPTPLQDAFLRSVADAFGFAAVISPQVVDIYPVRGGVAPSVAMLVMRAHREVTR